MKYEDLKYSDDILPIIFRKDTREATKTPVSLHWHDAVELLLVVEGEAHIQSDTVATVARMGEIVCVHSGHLHGYTAVKDKCTYYCLILPATLLPSAALYQSPLPLVSGRSEAVALYRQIVQTLEAQDTFYKEQAHSLITRLYIELARIGGDETPASDRSITTAVKEALRYIEGHYNEELHIESIARAVGVSRFHLCHIFKEVTGQTLSGYWQSVRCAKARKMLSHGASVTEAAEACGFSTINYFSRVYYKQFSVLPSHDKV